jgi:flagellar biosynthesis component FlhA
MEGELHFDALRRLMEKLIEEETKVKQLTHVLKSINDHLSNGHDPQKAVNLARAEIRRLVEGVR